MTGTSASSMLHGDRVRLKRGWNKQDRASAGHSGALAPCGYARPLVSDDGSGRQVRLPYDTPFWFLPEANGIP